MQNDNLFLTQRMETNTSSSTSLHLVQSHRSRPMTKIVYAFYFMIITSKQAIEQEPAQFSQLTAQSASHKVKLLLLI